MKKVTQLISKKLLVQLFRQKYQRTFEEQVQNINYQKSCGGIT